ncbi:YybS family protein [Cellulosilyticum ruminicola]|uniref:hypothetical protein n=1 Tax=Cellulosilyticum ruminicola TaxID=425254 RepID=UPI0006D174C2|nr:hypothetical protein [Cellulosilyticum ruminicola]
METRKLTKAAITSALLIVLSIVFCSIGIENTFYLQFIVPIVITVVYLTCGFKWTILAGLNTIVVIILVLGRMTAGVWLIQSVIVGSIVGYLLLRERGVMDDILIGALVGCPVMLFIDYFIKILTGVSVLTGISVLEEIGLGDLIGNKELIEGMYYFEIACIPIGTIVLTYVGGMIVAKHLNLLNAQTKMKYKMIKNFLRYKPYMYCSKSLVIGGMLYIVISTILPVGQNVYIKALYISMKYILIYFILMDAMAIISFGIYRKTGSVLLSNGVGIVIIILLVNWFKWSLYGMMLTSLVIDFKMKIRQKQAHILKCLVQY